MPFIIKWRAQVCWLGDGIGPINQNAQMAQLSNELGANSGYVVVPGGDSPTGANLTTAMTTCGTNMGTAANVAGTLATIQGFSTGGN